MRSVFLIGLACAALATPGICSIAIDGDEDENGGAGGAPVSDESDGEVEAELDESNGDDEAAGDESDGEDGDDAEEEEG